MSTSHETIFEGPADFDMGDLVRRLEELSLAPPTPEAMELVEETWIKLSASTINVAFQMGLVQKGPGVVLFDLTNWPRERAGETIYLTPKELKKPLGGLTNEHRRIIKNYKPDREGIICFQRPNGKGYFYLVQRIDT